MLEAWGELDLMTVSGELGLPPEILALLEELGTRYEIIDGQLVVNAPPTFSHEDLAGELFVQLRIASPPDIAVLGSGFKFFYAGRTEGNTLHHTMADITVVRRSDVEEQGTVLPPLLVVEVLSPSTRRVDLRRKREIYESTGVQTYLLLDPKPRTLTVLTLKDGVYEQTGQLTGSGELTLAEPFPVTVSPFG